MPLFVSYTSNEFYLRHQGMDVLKTISNAEKAACLHQANILLEHDLDKYVDRSENIEDAHFLWIMTVRPIRLDSLEGVILYYYLFFILQLVTKRIEIATIVLSKEFPDYVKNFLKKELAVPVSKNKKWAYDFNFKAINSLRPFKSFIQILRNRNATEKIPSNALWFVTNADFSLHRYRSFIDHYAFENKVFIHASNVRTITNLKNGDTTFNFAQFFKKKDVRHVLHRAYQLKRKAKQFVDHQPISNFIQSITTSEIMIMMQRDLLIDRAIKQFNPKAIFMTTANTYPPARLLSRQAYKYHIPSVIVAARPMLTNLRPEERTCRADIRSKNDAKVADYFVVWDLFSKNTLIEQGIQTENIFINQVPILEEKKNEFHLKSCFLFLLSDSQTNEHLMDVIFEVKKHSSLAIAVKRHRGVKENTSFMAKLNAVIDDLIDVSDLKLEDIHYEDVIAITANSSAGVEACSLGCGLIWLPYLDERSVIFHSVMKILGANYSNTSEFIQEITHSYNEHEYRENFIQECSANYTKYFIAENDSQHLVCLLNIA